MVHEPFLDIEALEAPPIVLVSQVGDVPRALWLEVLGRWGSEGHRPSVTVEVQRAHFLRNKDWVRESCRTHGVGVRVNELGRALLAGLQQTREALVGALDPDRPAADLDALHGQGSRFVGELRPFQVRDVGRLAGISHGANFSVPGAGKTASTLAIHELERLGGRIDRLLVVCPIAAFDSWIREVALWLRPSPVVQVFDGGSLPTASVVLVNYQRLEPGFNQLSAWMSLGSTHLVLDEAHRIKKGMRGLWGRLCLQLAFLAARRDVLTGTPAPQHPRDLEALLDFCWPGHARSLIPQDCLVRRPSDDAVQRAGVAIAPLFQRTTKNELGLKPPKIIKKVVSMGPLQTDIYDALVARYRGHFRLRQREQNDLSRIGQVVMYLLEASTNPALLPAGSTSGDALSFRHPPLSVEEDAELADLLRDYGQYETPAKFGVLAEILVSNAEAGKKTLVWSNFVRNLDYLANRLLTELNPAIVHGGIAPEGGRWRNRVDELRRFREDSDCLVLVANPAALGEGISLHDTCHDAVYLDRTFNAGQYLQSIDRIHRLGLDPSAETKVTVLVSPRTVDEVVHDRVRTKAERLQTLMDDPHLSAMSMPVEDPDSDEHSDPVEGSDLVDLFLHLSGSAR